MEHQHPIGKIAALRSIFNVGPFETSGSNEVINNLFFDYSDEKQYTIKGGPSTRRVIDFSDIENSVSILPTGQSGVQSSSHYSDQAKQYSNGEFRKMKLNKQEIINTATKLVFKPK
jgi:penicillin amidase